MGSFLSANKYPSGNVAIFLNILHRGAKARIYTKFTIPEKQWDRKKSKIKGAAYNENERLKELVDTGSKVIDFYKYQFQKPTAKELKNKFFELILTDEKYTKIIDLARIYIEDNLPDKKGNTERERNPTKINHKQTINLIDAIGLNTSCESIDIRWYNDFLRITKKTHAINTIGSHIKRVKAWMNYGNKLGVTKNNGHTDRRFIAIKERTEAVYLSKDEIQILKDFKCKPEQEDIKYMFLAGCYCGMRISDLINLDFRIERDTLFYVQNKTGKSVSIFLSPELKDIISKLSPLTNKNTFNKRLKKLCKAVGLEKWDKITSHTMRRSFATNAFLDGIPVFLIKKITGHSKDEDFYTYIRLSSTDESKLFAEKQREVNSC